MKNILIGFLGATCMFLMIGTKSESNVMSKIQTAFSENGRYQAFKEHNHANMIDTRTGVLYASKKSEGSKHKWVRVSAETNWIVE